MKNPLVGDWVRARERVVQFDDFASESINATARERFIFLSLSSPSFLLSTEFVCIWILFFFVFFSCSVSIWMCDQSMCMTNLSLDVMGVGRLELDWMQAPHVNDLKQTSYVLEQSESDYKSLKHAQPMNMCNNNSVRVSVFNSRF